jgi:hypothetical protein
VPDLAASSKIRRIEALRCSLFYNYCRVVAAIHVAGGRPQDVAAMLRATLVERTSGGPSVLRASFSHDGRTKDGAYRVIVESLLDASHFPASFDLVVTLGDDAQSIGLDVFSEAAFKANLDGLVGLPDLEARIKAFRSANGHRPKLLELGGRKRSGNTYAQALGDCDVTVFDIVAAEGVDVVGDAHELSQHFPPEHFDFVMSVSVFEHLLMPWKVALELNKVMKTGGYCLINSHQVTGVHEMPWDFWRFSDTAWSSLFNARTGFEMIEAGLGQFMQLVTVGWDPSYRGSEESGGFENSGALVRKVGPSNLEWDVSLTEVITTEYPTIQERSGLIDRLWHPLLRQYRPPTWVRRVTKALRQGGVLHQKYRR